MQSKACFCKHDVFSHKSLKGFGNWGASDAEDDISGAGGCFIPGCECKRFCNEDEFGNEVLNIREGFLGKRSE